MYNNNIRSGIFNNNKKKLSIRRESQKEFIVDLCNRFIFKQSVCLWENVKYVFSKAFSTRKKLIRPSSTLYIKLLNVLKCRYFKKLN